MDVQSYQQCNDSRCSKKKSRTSSSLNTHFLDLLCCKDFIYPVTLISWNLPEAHKATPPSLFKAALCLIFILSGIHVPQLTSLQMVDVYMKTVCLVYLASPALYTSLIWSMFLVTSVWSVLTGKLINQINLLKLWVNDRRAKIVCASIRYNPRPSTVQILREKGSLEFLFWTWS